MLKAFITDFSLLVLGLGKRVKVYLSSKSLKDSALSLTLSPHTVRFKMDVLLNKSEDRMAYRECHYVQCLTFL